MSSASCMVMYSIVRGDLRSWPLGALMAQVCHASTAVLWTHKDDNNTLIYMNNMDNMRKVVLEIADEKSLREISEVLASKNIEHKLWIEQPENEATCLAVKPYPKNEVFPLLRKLKLFS